MKVLNKKLIAVLAVMAFVFTVLAFCVMPTSVSASTNGFAMKNGAEAKMTIVEGSDTDYTGIRFTSTVKESYYTNLLNTYTGANIEIYTRISPKASDVEDFDVAPSEYAVDIKCSQPVVFDGDPNTDDVFTIRAAIVDFPVELYDLELYARAYIKIDGENSIPADTADNVRSVRDVANAAIIDGYDEDGVLTKYIQVGQRNEDVSGYITADGKGWATVGGLDNCTYNVAYIGAKKINASVENGVVNFELSENDLYILANKKLGDLFSLSVYDADGKVYSTFISLSDVAFANVNAYVKNVEGRRKKEGGTR